MKLLSAFFVAVFAFCQISSTKDPDSLKDKIDNVYKRENSFKQGNPSTPQVAQNGPVQVQKCLFENNAYIIYGFSQSVMYFCECPSGYSCCEEQNQVYCAENGNKAKKFKVDFNHLSTDKGGFPTVLLPTPPNIGGPKNSGSNLNVGPSKKESQDSRGAPYNPPNLAGSTISPNPTIQVSSDTLRNSGWDRNKADDSNNSNNSGFTIPKEFLYTFLSKILGNGDTKKMNNKDYNSGGLAWETEIINIFRTIIPGICKNYFNVDKGLCDIERQLQCKQSALALFTGEIERNIMYLIDMKMTIIDSYRKLNDAFIKNRKYLGTIISDIIINYEQTSGYIKDIQNKIDSIDTRFGKTIKNETKIRSSFKEILEGSKCFATQNHQIGNRPGETQNKVEEVLKRGMGVKYSKYGDEISGDNIDNKVPGYPDHIAPAIIQNFPPKEWCRKVSTFKEEITTMYIEINSDANNINNIKSSLGELNGMLANGSILISSLVEIVKGKPGLYSLKDLFGEMNGSGKKDKLYPGIKHVDNTQLGSGFLENPGLTDFDQLQFTKLPVSIPNNLFSLGGSLFDGFSSQTDESQSTRSKRNAVNDDSSSINVSPPTTDRSDKSSDSENDEFGNPEKGRPIQKADLTDPRKASKTMDTLDSKKAGNRNQNRNNVNTGDKRVSKNRNDVSGESTDSGEDKGNTRVSEKMVDGRLDIFWYTKKNSSLKSEGKKVSEKVDDEKNSEIERIKQLEQEAMAVALGLAPSSAMRGRSHVEKKEIVKVTQEFAKEDQPFESSKINKDDELYSATGVGFSDFKTSNQGNNNFEFVETGIKPGSKHYSSQKRLNSPKPDKYYKYSRDKRESRVSETRRSNISSNREPR
ncbi:hypothetical protein BB560_002943, partial [Smittium megazygosporum]